MSYYIQDFCSICLSISNEKWSKKFLKNPDNLTPFDKIKAVLLELSAVMDSDNRICRKCSDIVDLIYKFNKTCLKNIKILNSYKNILKENKLKKQCDLHVNLNESRRSNEAVVTSEKVNVETPESSLNNDDTFCDTDFASRGAAEVKKEIEMNYEICDEESEASWFDSETKIEIEETDLKKELMGEISEDESSKSNDKDSENIANPIIEREKVVNEAKEKMIFLEAAEGNSHLNQGDGESVRENQPSSSQETSIHSNGKEFESAECDETLSSKLDLNSHKRSHSKGKTHAGKKVHKCDICGKLFRLKSYLKMHMLIHTGENPHKCDICGKSCTTKSGLNSHMLIHTNRKLHKCNICGKLFKRRETLKLHSLIHSSKKTHKCNICGKLFTQKATVIRHILTHTNEKPHKCDICGDTFSRKDILKTHILKHTGEKPYNCDSCGKLFRQSSALREHMLTHTGEKSHKCDICGKLFAQRSGLTSHMLRHTDEKPHKCDICGKLFAQRSGVTRHMLTHTKEKSHKCDICGKFFTHKHSLQIHILTHTDQRSHKCDICEILFTQKSSLVKHMLTHTGEKPHKCDFCGKLFRRKDYLKVHKLMHTDK